MDLPPNMKNKPDQDLCEVLDKRCDDVLDPSKKNIFDQNLEVHHRSSTVVKCCMTQDLGSENIEKENIQKTTKLMTFEKQSGMNSTEKVNLCEHHRLPQWMQDNEYLLAHHRPHLPSFTACFLSIFSLHTETINIWTHLLGCVAFLSLAIHFLLQPVNFQHKLIFGIFFSTVILCLGLSFTFHTLHCHSPQVLRLFSKLDYCGITLLISGSSIAWIYYGFYCHPWLRLLYLSVTTVLGVSSSYIFLSNSESFHQPHYRAARAAVFTTFGLFGIIPGLHWTHIADWNHIFSFGCNVCLLVLVYILGAIFYTLRFPERLRPGTFDIFFHSHQILHVMVVIATFISYQGLRKFATYYMSNNNKCI